MSSQVALTVAYEDDTSQETFVYSGETIAAPYYQPTTWQLSGTSIQFSATTEPLPNSLGAKQRFQTITFMSIYSHKSIDELRFEDYQYMNVNQRNEKKASSVPPPKTTSLSSCPVSSSYCFTSPIFCPSSLSYTSSSPTYSNPSHFWSSPGMASSSGTSQKQLNRQNNSSAKSFQPGLSSSAFNINSSTVQPITVPGIKKGADFQAAFATNLTQKDVLRHEQMSTDSSTDESGQPFPSVLYSFTPNINFISETDPARVFTAPQPPTAVSEPLSSLSVSEGKQLRDALLESIVKCMHIQNSLYRLVLLKLQAHVTAATGKTNNYQSPSTVGVAQRTESSTERLNNAPKTSNMGCPYDTAGTTSMESTVGSSHDTSGISSLVDAGAIVNDTRNVSSVKNTKESLNDAPETLLDELKTPLQALTRCTGIQRELFQRLITVTAITSKEETVLSELHTKGKVNMLSVQSKLEAIAFKTKMECTYARNPFSNHQPKLSTSEDVVQHISSHNHRSFSVGADGGSRSLRDVPHGRGRLETVSGEVVYSGEWCKGKRQGKGECLILSLPDVSTDAIAEHGFYNGGWKNNMRHGHGQMMFSSGAVYEGQWQYDKMTGYGTLKFPDGTIEEGVWKKGSLQGCALFTWPHGVTEYREYHTNRAQLSFRTIEKGAAENLSQMSSIRSQMLNLSECVTELKDEKLRLTEQLNAQKLEHDEMVGEIHTTVSEIRESYKEKWERESQAQLEELHKAADQVAVVKKELEEAKAGLLCQICFEQRRDCIILPCSHLLYCRKCVTEHKRKGDSRCPTCRGPINSEILCNLN